MEGLGSEIGVGIGVEADPEVAVIDCCAVIEGHREVRLATVVVTKPGIEGGEREQRMPSPPFELASLFDLFYDGSIESDAGVEQEVSAVR